MARKPKAARQPRAFVDNAADEAQVADGKRREAIQRTRELDDLRAVLDVPAGCRMLWRLITRCHLFRTSLVDGQASAALEGERNIGLFLLAECEDARTDAYTIMRQSAQESE